MISFTPVDFVWSVIGIIFLWQIFCFIVYEIGHESDDLLTKVSMCFIVAFAMIFGNIYQACRLWYAHHYLDGYGWCYPDRKGPYIVFYMTKKEADKFCQDESAPYHIKKIREGKDFKSVPYKQDIYKGQTGMWHGHQIEKFLKKD